MKGKLIIAGITAIAVSGCASAPFKTDRDELAAARTAISEAKAAGAENCAPELLAKAESNLYWAAHELDEKGMHAKETKQLITEAETSAKYAKLACAPKPAAEPVQEVISLTGVNFKHDSATLTSDSLATLDKAVETLNSRSEIKVEVAAHTDSTGSDSYNQKLSERRAASVEKYLLSHGIEPGRLSVRGYGESSPIATNDTEEGRAQNRRVELRVLN